MPLSKVCLGILVLAIIGVYTLRLGNFPLTERSEARYTGVAWEMLKSGDYLTPRYNGIKHFHKPPFFYWIAASSMALFGATEGAARLPCALAALLTLALTAALSRRQTMGCPTWWLAPACLATAPFFWEMGRIAVTDMLVTLFVTSALLAAWRLLESGASMGPLLVFWASLGLGFLTKGPVGPLIVAMVVLPYLWRSGSSWRVFHPLPGMALASVIGLPWYIWVTTHNPGLLQYFLKFQTADRVFTTVHQRGGPPWFYLPVLIGGFLPWTLWLPSAIKKGLANAKVPASNVPNPDLFLLLWLVGPVLFFSAIGSKLPPYVLPVFPAMALLVARHLPSRTTKTFTAPTLLLAAVALASAVFWLWNPIPRLGKFAPDFGWAAVVLAVGSLCGWIALRKKQEVALVVTLVATMLGLLFLATAAFSKLAHLSAQGMAASIRGQARGPFEVAMYRYYLFGLPYYLGQNLVHVEFDREVQFETNKAYGTRLYPDLATYVATFRRGDIDRFLIVSLRDAPEVQRLLGESVVYSDDKFIVLKHPAERRAEP